MSTLIPILDTYDLKIVFLDRRYLRVYVQRLHHLKVKPGGVNFSTELHNNIECRLIFN